MEKNPHPGLSSLLADIAHSEEERRQAREREGELIRQSRALYVQVLELVSRFGVEEALTIGTGAGEGIIGARLERTTHKVTPIVPIATEQGEVLLRLVEEIKGGPGYSINHAGYSLRAQLPEGAERGEERQLFHFMQDLVVNWINKQAGMNEMEIASELLTHVRASLENK